MDLSDTAVLPVIDLLGGQVVHAVAGQRHNYRPLESWLSATATAADVASGLQQEYGFQDIYVADLDAIAGRSANLDSLQAIVDRGLRLHLDAGLKTAADAQFWLASSFHPHLDSLLIASETLASEKELREIAALAGSLACFSLDLRNAALQVQCPEWSAYSPAEMLQLAFTCGIRRALVLDLANVGQGTGCPTVGLCQQLRERFPELTLWSGGGVRDLDGVRELQAYGVDRVLIASALHRRFSSSSDGGE